jgi:hypothetical protein
MKVEKDTSFVVFSVSLVCRVLKDDSRSTFYSKKYQMREEWRWDGDQLQ